MHLPKLLINQIRKTNDKIIVANESGEPQVVILSYDTYQQLLRYQEVLTNDKFLDKINRIIAQLRETEKQQKTERVFFIENMVEKGQKQKSKISIQRQSNGDLGEVHEEEVVYLEQ